MKKLVKSETPVDTQSNNPKLTNQEKFDSINQEFEGLNKEDQWKFIISFKDDGILLFNPSRFKITEDDNVYYLNLKGDIPNTEATNILLVNAGIQFETD